MGPLMDEQVFHPVANYNGLPKWYSGREPSCQCMKHWSPVFDPWDALEEEMATHSNDFAWEIPWPEEPGGLQSMGSQRVGHN